MWIVIVEDIMWFNGTITNVILIFQEVTCTVMHGDFALASTLDTIK